MISPSLLQDFLVSPDSGSVAHYTRIGNLHNLFHHRAVGWSSAWATPVQFLNDRLELMLGLQVLDQVAKTNASSNFLRSHVELLIDTLGDLASDAYQMSFSANPDDLGQWRGYAANGMGCSIVTSIASIKSVADVAGYVYYDEAAQRQLARRVLAALASTTDSRMLTQTLVAAASYMKDSGFTQEQEFRLIVFPESNRIRFREVGERLVPYVDYLDASGKSLDIERILIGPGWQLARMEPDELAKHHVALGIQRLLDARGIAGVTPESSAIPYDPR